MGAQSKTPEREIIRKMLDDVEAVTKGRFYEDPEPIAGPVEMFRVRDGGPGGETFPQLSMREKHQVFGDYTDWQAYEAGGLSFEQLDQVFWNAAHGKPREQWLDGTGLQDLDRNKSPAERSEHGKSGNSPSRPAKATTDDERKLVWMESIRRLDAAYMAGGTDALAKMNGIEIHVLYAEKMTELEAVRTGLTEHGDNAIGQWHKQKLERQTADMAAWMRLHCPDFREMGQEAAGKDLTDVQQGNGKASLMPDKWDAIYQLWRVERKPDLVTLLRAAAELPEMADVPLGHFKAAYDVMKEGEWGCFRNSMSEFPTSRGMEQDAFKTSLAELKEMATERTKQPEDRKSRDRGMEK